MNGVAPARWNASRAASDCRSASRRNSAARSLAWIRACSIAAGTIYTHASRKLVLSFKHGGKIALAPMLARMIAEVEARMTPYFHTWKPTDRAICRWWCHRSVYSLARSNHIAEAASPAQPTGKVAGPNGSAAGSD